MNDSRDTNELIKEISANQQSLHDYMAALADKMASLEQTILNHVTQTPEPLAIDDNQLYMAARSLVAETGRASTSMLQRVLRIGYSRAAGLMDRLEENNLISPADGSRPREVFIDPDKLEELEDEESEPRLYDPQLDSGDDELYEDAKQAVIEAGKASTSYIQRKLRVGYSRACRLMDMLEENGVIGPADGSKPRDINSELKE
jgi:DNA segregation ATPase FtsK/SpoIIIE-like protein